MDFRLLDPNAAARGVENVNAWADAAAKRRAGAMIAEDPRAAMSHLQRNGLLGDAMNVQQGVWAEENRSIAATERERAEEDRQRGIELEAEKREADALGAMATNLQSVLSEHGVEAVLPAFDQMAAGWMANGADAESVAQMREALATNPEPFLTATAGAVSAANQRYQLWQAGNSAGTFDRRTGQVTEQFRAPRYERVGTGQDLVEIDGMGGLSGGEAPSGGAPAPTGGRPAGAPAAREGTPAERNAALQSEILAVIPNARMGSGVRTPERQAELVRDMPGIAVPNSRHPTGDAQDFQIPGKGEADLPEVRRMLQEGGVEFEDVIFHNNHFHIERGPNGGGAAPTPRPQAAPSGGGPRVIARGRDPAPRAGGVQWRTMTPEEVETQGLRAGGSYQINSNGQTRVAQQPPAAGRGGAAQPGGRLSPQDNAFLNKLRTDATAAMGVANLYAQMEPLARRVDTGGMMSMPGAGSVVGAVNPEVRRFMQLTDQMTPGMRQGLPGAASDRDVAMFRSATPSIDKPREANLAAIAAGRAWGQRQGDYVAFIEQWARDNGSLLGASEEWNRYTTANPLFADESGNHGMPTLARVQPWRTWFGRPRAPSGGAAPAPARPAAPAAGNRRRYNPATGRIE